MLFRYIISKQIQLINTSKRFRSSNTWGIGNISEMAEHGYMGNSLQVILDRLAEFAPLELASTWDNVGLLVDPMTDTKIRNILLTNDLTEEIVQEAITTKSGLIISYHPNIFEGLKSVSHRTWKERVVIECIKNNIAVFSPHTSWDAVKGGVNDWLAKALPIQSSQAIIQNVNDPAIGAGRLCSLEKGITIQEAIKMVKKHIGLPYLRLAAAKKKQDEELIYTVAFCAGSGNSVLNGVDADLYVTGEMLHHDILDATQRNVHVILCNHSDSERGFLRYFQKELENDILKGEAKIDHFETNSVDKHVKTILFNKHLGRIGNISKMAGHGYMGNSLQVILDRLAEFASLELASTWDNVGLLVDPMTDTKIRNILLTNDLTEEIVQEAHY